MYLVFDESWTTLRNMLLTCGLYAFAARNPALGRVMQGWMEKRRAALARHFAPDTAKALDTMTEGLSTYRAVDPQSADRSQVRSIVEPLVPWPSRAASLSSVQSGVHTSPRRSGFHPKQPYEVPGPAQRSCPSNHP